MEFKHFRAGQPPLEVHMLATRTASGLIIQLLGGDKPHIGATVITHPRPSLTEPGKVSCNSIVIPELGHKEDELAKPLAEKVAINYNCPVVVVAGIHVEHATDVQIKQIKNLCEQLVNKLIASCPL
ncbi:prenylated flavin chaperone LpdD [Desulfoscipio sp. XC116]|uniref:prenylated flavin chaperone LpdD n=1 Tax=Desulfoscipio sp. XC116 TaxID=3144975 RepID=UPI00325C13A9